MRSSLSWLARHTPLRWLLPNKIDRMTVLQRAIDGISARSYLEIGVADGECFCTVQAPGKIGVDPVPARPDVVRELERPGVSYASMTSDAFFEQEAPRVLSGGVDVVFIDGLHTFGQAYRDVTNALRYLNPNGLIFVHDCLPTSAAEARVAATYDEAWALNGPGWSGLWTGDGWKAIVAVRSGHPDTEARVLHCDHGVGVIYRAPNQSGLRYTADEIAALDYADLSADPQSLIGLCRPSHLHRVLYTRTRH